MTNSKIFVPKLNFQILHQSLDMPLCGISESSVLPDSMMRHSRAETALNW